MNKDDIIKLAEKISSGIATEHEMIAYNRICNSLQAGIEEWDSDIHGDKNEMAALMKKAIWEKSGIGNKRIQFTMFKWVAAASIFAAISITALYFFKPVIKQNTLAKTQPQSKRFKNDVDPGKEGAILTLPGGKTILLDSAGNGSLATQGADGVIKKDGQIIYQNKQLTSEIVYNTMSTPKGRQYSLVLADGTSVWLNAASSITFPTVFSGNERRVTITGEVYFEVAHNAQKIFVVQKGETSVEVLGTHFNINSYDDESSLNITLLEGSVKVRNSTRVGMMRPGQQAQVLQNKIDFINNANTDAVMAWKNGLFDFEGIDLGMLMRQLARWYDVDIEYNNKINDLFFAQIPRNTPLSVALKALELTGKVKFKIEGKKIIVVSK